MDMPTKKQEKAYETLSPFEVKNVLIEISIRRQYPWLRRRRVGLRTLRRHPRLPLPDAGPDNAML